MAEQTLEAPAPTTDVTPSNIPSTEALKTSTDPIDRITLKRNERQAKEKANEKPAETKPEGEKPAIETPPETIPSVNGEAKPAEEKPKAKKESFKNKWKKEKKGEEAPKLDAEGKPVIAETKPAEAPKFEIPKDIQDRLAQYDALLSDPSVKLVLKAKESGKDFSAYYDELKSKDPYKMDYPSIYKMQLEEMGLNKDEIARKMERFGERDEDDQLDIVAPFRKELKGRFDKELNDFTPTFKEPEPEVSPFNDLENDIKTVAPQYKGRDIFGIEATPERLASAMDISKGLVSFKDGKIDANDYLETKFLKDNFEIIAETIWEKAELETTEKLEAIYNVGKPLHATTGGAEPQPSKQMTDTDKRVKNLQASLPQRKAERV